MTLVVPENLKFNPGSNTENKTQSRVDMSLDELIKSRRKENKANAAAAKKKTAGGAKPKSSLQNASKNASRKSSRLTQKVNRSAVTNYKRGLRKTNKATKTEVANEKKKTAGGDSRPSGIRVSNRRSRLRGSTSSKRSSTRITKNGALKTPRPPTKKAIKAAVSAMSNVGFKVPDGHKVVISVQKDTTTKTTPPTKNNNNRGKGGGKK